MMGSDEALPDCKLASEEEARVAAEIAEAHFMKTVGIEIDSIAISAISLCKAGLVVPIEAITARTEIPRLWFVEIDANNSKNIHLIRPE